jgi:hypothetical protein
MTRCMNCGAERDADICGSCGLSSTAAEFLLRKNLLNRTGLFLLGAIAFVAASGRYPALDLDGILIFIGILFFLTLGLAIWLERRALRHVEVEALKRIYYGLIPVPWLLAGLLLANGALDHAPPRTVQAHVVGKFAMRGWLPSRRLIVTSWRDGHQVERLLVDSGDFDSTATGDTVDVRIKDGFVGIPWVLDVTPR